ncbi:MAG: tRNA cytidylyltransferase [Gemmatimonadota bacterium]
MAPIKPFERLPLPAEILEIAERLEQAGYETWCVGGALRDALLGTPPDDVDLATAAPPEAVQRLFRHTVPVGIAFGTVGVLDRHRRLHEVTTFRRDVTTDGRHAVVEYGVSLDDDLARRDFTINALAYHPVRGEWRDPFGGAADLGRRVIRAVGDPATRFREDFLRILRGIRFAARLGFTIDPATWSAALAEADGLAQLSAERVRDEWFKSLDTAASLLRLTELWRTVGATRLWLRELLDPYPLATESPPDRDPVLLTVALCEDACQVLGRLKASNREIERARRMMATPPAPADESVVAVRRWLAQAGPAADDVIALSALKQGSPPAFAPVAAEIRARGEPLARGDLAVDGRDLVALGIPAGPLVGRTLDRLLDLVLQAPDRNTKPALLEAARAFQEAAG